jgi:hypothetical protein
MGASGPSSTRDLSQSDFTRESGKVITTATPARLRSTRRSLTSAGSVQKLDGDLLTLGNIFDLRRRLRISCAARSINALMPYSPRLVSFISSKFYQSYRF